MSFNFRFVVLSLFACSALWHAETGVAHEDIIVQRTDPSGSNKLLTGTIDFDAPPGQEVGMPVRVFEAELEADGFIFEEHDPGFNAFTNESPWPPTGTFALPGDTALNFTIQPFTINSQSSDLFYWDGVGEVAFGPAVATTTLSVAGAVANDPLASKSGTIGTTDSDGFLHAHHDYELESLLLDTAPDVGIYLAQFMLHMDGVNDSDPFWIVFATEGASHHGHHEAADWVYHNLVIPEPATWAIALLGIIGAMLGGRGRRC